MNKIKKMFLKVIGYEEIWTLGFRKIQSGKLWHDTRGGVYEDGFTIVNDLKKYWYADPILFSHEGKEYCFFEMYDRKLLKGGIGVAEVTDNGLENIRLIIEEEFHMSYPTVFKLGNHILMIPECSEKKEIRIYQCLDFPEKWECVKCFEGWGNYTDTNIITVEGSQIILDSSVYNADNPFQTKTVWNKLEIDFDANKYELISEKEGMYSYLDRNGGAIVRLGNKLYVPKQISKINDYGLGLNFYEYDVNGLKHKEQVEKAITANDVRTDIKKKITGVHTYARGSVGEVIDVRILSFNPYKWIRRFRKHMNSR